MKREAHLPEHYQSSTIHQELLVVLSSPKYAKPYGVLLVQCSFRNHKIKRKANISVYLND